MFSRFNLEQQWNKIKRITRVRAPNILQNTSTYTLEIGRKPHARTYQKDSLLLVVGFVERVKVFVESLLFLIFCDLPLLVLVLINMIVKMKNNGYSAHFGASQWIKVAIATCSHAPWSQE